MTEQHIILLIACNNDMGFEPVVDDLAATLRQSRLWEADLIYKGDNGRFYTTALGERVIGVMREVGGLFMKKAGE